MRQKRQDERTGDCGDYQVDYRPGGGNADIASGVGIALPHVFHQRDSADGEQNDGPHGHAVAVGHYRVPQFVQYNAAEDDPHQRQAAHCARRAHGHRLREPHKRQQKNKGKVDADVHAKQSPCGN